MGDVVVNDVVAEKEQCILGQPVESLQAAVLRPLGHGKGVAGVGTVGGGGQKAAVVLQDLQVQRETTPKVWEWDPGAWGWVPLF